MARAFLSATILLLRLSFEFSKYSEGEIFHYSMSKSLEMALNSNFYQ